MPLELGDAIVGRWELMSEAWRLRWRVGTQNWSGLYGPLVFLSTRFPTEVRRVRRLCPQRRRRGARSDAFAARSARTLAMWKMELFDWMPRRSAIFEGYPMRNFAKFTIVSLVFSEKKSEAPLKTKP